jgi:hypothetical protein
MTYTVKDNDGATSNEATILITVNALGAPVYDAEGVVGETLIGGIEIDAEGVVGETLYGGMSPAPSITNNEWTATKDGAGVVTAASLQELPVATKEDFRAHLIVGVDPVAEITSQLIANGFNPAVKGFGTAPVQGSFTGWVGAVYDEINQILYLPWGGGHDDSSLNGIWGFNLRTLEWFIVDMPSDPDDATYPWSQKYKDGDAGSYSVYIDDAGVKSTVLPDGRPPSMHTYGGVVLENRKLYTTRNSVFSYDLDTGVYENKIWKDTLGGVLTPKPTIDHYVFQHNGISHGVMKGDVGSYDWHKCLSLEDPVRTVETGKPSQLWNYGSHFVTRLDDTRLFYMSSNHPRFSIFHMDTGIWEPAVDLTGDLPVIDESTQESQANLYLASWGNQGSILRQFSEGSLKGQWYLIDIETGLQTRFYPTGYPQEIGTWVGNKAFVADIGGIKAFIYICVKSGVSETYITRLA